MAAKAEVDRYSGLIRQAAQLTLRRAAVGIVVACLATSAASALGIDYRLINTPGNWNTAADWNDTVANPGVPGINDSAIVGSTFGAAVNSGTVQLNTGEVNRVQRVHLGLDANTDGTVTLNGPGANLAMRIELTMGTQTDSSGTLNLNNAGVTVQGISIGAGFVDGISEVAVGAGNPTATFSLNNNSHLNIARELRIGNSTTGLGTASISLDGTSSAHVNGILRVRGDGTYNLPLASRQQDGMFSVRDTLTVAEGGNDSVIFNVTAANGAAAKLGLRNELFIGTGTGTLNIDAVDLRFASNVTRSWIAPLGTANINLTNGSNLHFGNELRFGQENGTNGVANISISPNSQINVDGTLMFMGTGVYDLPFSSRNADGKFAIHGQLEVANRTNSNVTLNFNPANGGDAQIGISGGLIVGNGGNATGIVNLNGTSLAVSGNGSFGFGSSGQINLTNGGHIRFGANLDWGNQADLSISSDSQASVRGGLDFYHTNSTVTLPFASTAQDGKLALIAGNLSIAGAAGNLANQTVSINSATSAPESVVLGSLVISTQANSQGALNIDGVTVGFSANSNIGLNSSSTAGIVLINGAVLRLGGNLLVGPEAYTTLSVSNDSRLNINTELETAGSGTWNLPLASRPENGKVSFRTNLLIADDANEQTQTVNVTAANGAAALQNHFGVANVATHTNTIGTLNVEGVNLGFTSNVSIGTGHNSTGGLNVSGGGILDAGNDLYIGGTEDGGSTGVTTVTVSANSQINADNQLAFRGYTNGVNTRAFSYGLSSVPTDGTISVVNSLLVADVANHNVSLTLTADSADMIRPSAELVVGGNGNIANAIGALNISGNTLEMGRDGYIGNGAAGANGTITLDNATLAITRNGLLRNNNNTASATVQGTGTFDGGNSLTTSGRIVADGGLLNVDFGNVAQNEARPIAQGDGTQAGWYATGGGTLALKTLDVTGDVTWGDNFNDSARNATDLVNSVRFAWTGLTNGQLNGGLADTSLAGGLTNAIGLWEFDPAGSLAFTNSTLTFRYDNIAAGVNEANMKVFQLQAGTWTDVTGALDVGNKQITTTALTGLGNFAIATGATNDAAIVIADFAGNRATATTIANAGSGNFVTDGDFSNLAPQSRDNVDIGSGNTADVTLNSGGVHRVNNLVVGRGAATSDGMLLVDNGSELRATDGFQLGRDVNTSGTLTIDNGSQVKADFSDNNIVPNGFAISAAAAGGAGSNATINVLNGSVLEANGAVQFGATNTAIGSVALTIDPDAQFNVDGDLYLRGAGVYSIPMSGKVRADGALSVDESIIVADTTNNNVELTITKPTGVSRAEMDGYMLIGTGTNATGKVTIDGGGTGYEFNIDGQAGGVVFGSDSIALGVGGGTASGTLELINAQVHTHGNLEIGQRNGAGGGGAVILDANSQLNLGFSVLLRGTGSYNLPLTSVPTNGKISFTESLLIADTNANNVTLTVNNATSAASAKFDGALNIGIGNDSVGTLNMTNVDWAFAGDFNWSTAGNANTQSNVTLTNAKLQTNQDLFIGTNNNSPGTASINIDSSSQLNVGRNLWLRGTGTYTLPLASRPTDGKLSFSESLLVAATTNNDVTLNVNAATSASQMDFDGSLNVGGGTGATGLMNISGVRMNFAGGGNAGGGTGSGDIVLSNGAELAVRGDFFIAQNGGNTGTGSVTINDTSSLHSGGNLFFRGGATYNPALADRPTAGKLSFTEGLRIADTQNNAVTVNVNSVTSLARLEYEGDLRVAQAISGSPVNLNGTLNIDGVEMNFANTGYIGTQATTTTRGELNLTNGAKLGLALDLLLGTTGAAGNGVAAISLDSSSQINVGQHLYVRQIEGGVLTAGLAERPTDGAISVRDNLVIADLDNNAVSFVTANAGGQVNNFYGEFDLATGRGAVATLSLDNNRIHFGRNGDVATNIPLSSINPEGVILLNNNSEVSVGDDFTIRGNVSASARVQGSGWIAAGDILRMNGRMIADGGDLTVGYTTFQQTLAATQGDGTVAGWYAVNAGKVNLPSQSIAGNLSWGENPGDVPGANFDLVNAVRFENWDVTGGTLLGSLLASDQPGVYPGLINPVGIWDFSTTDSTFSSVDMTFHFDSALASFLGVAEADLKLFHNDGSGWALLPSTTNEPLDLLTSTGVPSFSQFAIAENFQNLSAVPEPSTWVLSLVGLAGLGLFVWRKRTRARA